MLQIAVIEFIKGHNVTISCYSDNHFIQAMNSTLPNVDFSSLASDLHTAPESYKCTWNKSEWYSYYTNGDGDGPLIFLDYEASTIWGPLFLSRDISFEKGILIGNNVLLKVPEELQGKGISRRLNAIMYTVYKAAGVKVIRAKAALDAGGYVWALAGFYATNQDEVRAILNSAREKAERNTFKNQTSTLTPALCELLQKRVDLHYGINPNKTFPMQVFSSLDCGEEILMRTEWSGELNLLDLSQMSIFAEYLKKENV